MSFEYSLLAEVADVIDSSHQTPTYVEYGVPMVRVTDVKYGALKLRAARHVSIETFQNYSRRYKAKRRDIIISRVGSYGNTAWVVETEFCLGQNVASISPKAIDARYLFFALNSSQFWTQVESKVVGSTQKTLSLKAIRELRIPRLGKSVECEVGALLGALDDRIAILRETNATLESIAQALFKSWFVDFDPVRAKQQGLAPVGMDEATATLFPDGFEDSSRGSVPKGWCWATMSDVSNVGIGKTPPRKEQHWFSTEPVGLPWASIKDMGEAGTFIAHTSEYLTDGAVQRFNVRVVPEHTVILSFKLTVGRVSITDQAMVTNEAIAHFNITNGQSPVSTEFIYCHLKQFDYTGLSSTSSIAEAINSKTVKGLTVLVPSPQVVAAFDDAVGPLFERLRTNTHHLDTLTQVRDTLLPRLISGQLRLPDDSQAEPEAILEDIAEDGRKSA